MRKIHGKRFLALLLGTAILGGSVFAIHYFQYQRIGQALLWQVRRAEEQGQVQRGVKYLQRYLEFNPRDQAEKANLAKTWAGPEYAGNLKARGSAVRLLDEVLTLSQEDNPELRRLLVKTALEVRDLKVARDHLAHLCTWNQMNDRIASLRAAKGKFTNDLAGEDADKGELEGFWGQLLEAENKIPDALDSYRLSLHHIPVQQIAYVRLANLLRRQNDADPEVRGKKQAEANKAIDALVNNNRDLPDVYLVRWRYRRTFDLLDIRESLPRGEVTLADAEKDVSTAMEKAPDSVETMLAAADLERLHARLALENGKLTLEQRMEGLKSHRDKALDYLKRGLERLPKNGSEMARFQLLWHKGNLLLDDLDRLDVNRDVPLADTEAIVVLKNEIRTLIEEVRKTSVAAAGEYLQGRLLVHERRWAEAATLFEQAQKMLAPQPDLAAQADLYLGQCYGRLEEHKAMYDAYKRVLDRDPTSVAAQLGMAMARKAQGRLEDARNEYALVMSQNKVPSRGWFDIAELEIQCQLQKDPKTRNWSDAEKVVEQAEKNNFGMVTESVLLRVNLLVQQQQFAKAEEHLRRGLENRPKEAKYYSALANLALEQKKFDEAREVLNKAATEAGDRVVLRLARSRLLALQPKKDSVQKIRSLADNRTEFFQEDQSELVNGLADILFRLGAEKEARDLWIQMAAMSWEKNNLRLRLLLFDLAMKAGDPAAMDQCLENIKAIEQSSGTFHLYGMALKLIWQVQNNQAGDRTAALAKARTYLDQVLAQRASWPPVFVARAEIAVLNRNPEQAIKDLQQAMDNGDSSTGVVRRRVTLLAERGRFGEADLVLQQHQRALQSSVELNRVAAGIALRQNKIEHALTLARNLVNDNKERPADMIWMSRVLAEAKKFLEAEEKINLAITKSEKEPEAWLAKVQFLVSQKRKADAEKTVTELSTKIAAEKLPLTLARCALVIQGPGKKTTKAYDAALAAQPKDPTVMREVADYRVTYALLKEAEPLLRPLATGEVKGTAEDQAWARQTLAVVLASGGDYQRFLEAMSLVSLKIVDGHLVRDEGPEDENTDMRRARARVLASQSQKMFRDRAVEILEGLRKERALKAEDQYLLVLLYDAQGQAKRAEKDLKELVQGEPEVGAPVGSTRTPQYLARYTLQLIAQHKDLDEAKKYIKLLEKLEKEREAGPNAFASVDLQARLHEARKEGDEALKLLREHTERKGASPEEVLLVLASLARQKRFDEAYEMCEKIWQEGKVRPEAIGGVSVSLLQKMKKQETQILAVEKHLKKALADAPESVVLRMHLSELYNRLNRYEDAEKMYREILARDKANVVALNNLAWLLANRSGDASEALGHINRALESMGRRADLLDTRALVYLALNDPDRAITDLKEAVNDAPSANRLFHLARAHHQNKDRNRARQSLDEARKQGLETAQLHPVEQPICDKLLSDYGYR